MNNLFSLAKMLETILSHIDTYFIHSHSYSEIQAKIDDTTIQSMHEIFRYLSPFVGFRNF